MKFDINRNTLLPVLQDMVAIVEKNTDQGKIDSGNIYSNIKLSLTSQSLVITGGSGDIELITKISFDSGHDVDIVVSARKLFDIFRALPDDSTIHIKINENQLFISSARSRFTLACLPGDSYPKTEEIKTNVANFKIKQEILINLLGNTCFSIAQQDVRYYLNGLLLEINETTIKVVATDGHRLALDEYSIDIPVDNTIKVIIPKKGIIELLKLLQNPDDEVDIKISQNHFRVESEEMYFTIKLIDGQFPEYQKVIPELSKHPVVVNKSDFREALTRISVLLTRKQGVSLVFNQNSIKALSANDQQESAEAELEAEYSGDKVEIGFNPTYLLDIFSTINADKVKISIVNPDSSCLILPEDESRCQYVVMPMRL